MMQKTSMNATVLYDRCGMISESAGGHFLPYYLGEKSTYVGTCVCVFTLLCKHCVFLGG